MNTLHTLPQSRILVILVLALLPGAVTLFAEVALPFGDKPGEVGFFNKNNQADAEPGCADGPLAFRATKNQIWVADTQHGTLLCVDSAGKVQKSVPLPKSGKNCFADDLLLDFDGSGNLRSLYALEGDSQTIFQLSLDGKELKKFGGYGKQPGGILQGNRIEKSSQGDILVGDMSKKVITMFGSDGRFKREIPWQWSGFFIDAKDRLHRLWFDPAKKSLTWLQETLDGQEIKSTILKIGGHRNPKLWFVKATGEALVTSFPEKGLSPNLRCWVFSAEGTVVKQIEIPYPVKMNRFIDAGQDSSLWVAETDYRLAPKGTLTIKSISVK
jgi:hypothetical protein